MIDSNAKVEVEKPTPDTRHFGSYDDCHTQSQNRNQREINQLKETVSSGQGQYHWDFTLHKLGPSQNFTCRPSQISCDLREPKLSLNCVILQHVD